MTRPGHSRRGSGPTSGVLRDRVVVITGGGRGIGRACALGAAAHGAAVIVADYGVNLDGSAPNSGIAEITASEIRQLGGRAHAVADTVVSMSGAQRMIDSAVDTWGRVDGVICCAGIVRHRPFLKISEDDWDEVINTHLKGHFTIFQAAARAMVDGKTGGSLVGISSAYLLAVAHRANYRAAKAGIVALCMTAAIDLAEHGIRVNCIAPVADTRMTQQAQFETESRPEDIAPMAVYLLSPASDSTTGRIYGVDGQRISAWQDPFENRSVKKTSGSSWTVSEIAAEMRFLQP